MTCPDMQEQMSAWVDGELPPDLTAAVDGHLASCVSCRMQARSMRALKHAIAQLPSREAPPGAVRARVEALRFQRRRAGAVRAAAWLASAVACVAIVMGIFYFGPLDERPDSLAAMLAAVEHGAYVTPLSVQEAWGKYVAGLSGLAVQMCVVLVPI